MSDLIKDSDEITADAKPDGEMLSFQRKLPKANAAVIALDTEQSMPSDSNKLFNMTWAFKIEEDLKNSLPSASESVFDRL